MGWLTAEAKKWGVDINSDGLRLKQPTVALVSYKTFTLNAKGCPNGRYLLTFPETACDLCESCVQPPGFFRNDPMLTTKKKNIYIAEPAKAFNVSGKKSFSISSQLQSKGCALLGPKTAESKEDLRLYLVEDAITGKPTNEVHCRYASFSLTRAEKVMLTQAR